MLQHKIIQYSHNSDGTSLFLYGCSTKSLLTVVAMCQWISDRKFDVGTDSIAIQVMPDKKLLSN